MSWLVGAALAFGCGQLRTWVLYRIDEPIFCTLVRRHPVITIGVFGDLLCRAIGVLRHDLIELLTHRQNLFGVNCDFCRCTACSTDSGLMDHHA